MKRIIVLDTNCLVQSLPSKSIYHKIWTDFMNGNYFLCVSNEILNEYQEIIERYSSATIACNIVDAIIHSPYTVYNESYYKFNMIESDPDDNKFVDCAICSNAEFIVTEDSHFNVLKNIPFPKVKIRSLDQFLNDLK